MLSLHVLVSGSLVQDVLALSVPPSLDDKDTQEAAAGEQDQCYQNRQDGPHVRWEVVI